MTDTEETKDFAPSSLHSDNLPALLQGLIISLALTLTVTHKRQKAPLPWAGEGLGRGWWSITQRSPVRNRSIPPLPLFFREG